MLEGAGLDAARVDEAIDLVGLEADDAPEAVRRQLALVDEAVQRARGDAQTMRRFRGAQPVDLARRHRSDILLVPPVTFDPFRLCAGKRSAWSTGSNAAAALAPARRIGPHALSRHFPVDCDRSRAALPRFVLVCLMSY